MLKQGDLVRHLARPDWGVGEVLLVRDHKIKVDFEHGLVTLDLRYAGPQLESVSSEGVEPGRRGKRSRKPTA